MPLWIDYTRVALAGVEEQSRPLPAGVTTLRIDPATGAVAAASQDNAIFEYFLEEFAPEPPRSTEHADGPGSETIDPEDLF